MRIKNGLRVIGEDCVMGWHYVKGVYKEMTFGEVVDYMLGDGILPPTFEKQFSLEPLLQVYGSYLIPGPAKPVNSENHCNGKHCATCGDC